MPRTARTPSQDPEIRLLSALADPTRLAIVRELAASNETCACDFTEFVSELCSAPKVSMRKGALAKIEVDRPLQTAGGTLRWLIPPDAVRPKR